jgi:hypothetical protein
MHWQVIDTAVANICFLSANKNICWHSSVYFISFRIIVV